MLKTTIFFLGFMGLFFAQENINNSKDPDPNRYREAIEYFRQYDNKNTFPEGAILFIGSSSIRLWATAKYFPGYPVINRGFGGSHISDIIYFIEPLVIKYKPRIIVFYAGDNDIAAGKNADQAFNDYKEYVQLVREQLPKSKIIYLPIKPSLARWSLWEDMNEANRLIRIFAEEDESLYYADTATPMLGNESLPDSSLFVEDGLHLNANGYELWSEILMPVLEKTFNVTK
ncbi:MAG: hypothetical protein KAV45_12385 [Calditrichia bacterium]|jgi:lysophospholipase L1-like esterase|nr:hypothetical protein [Calditrichia bacterium]